MSPVFTAIESFAGAGGMSLGLQKAGFDVRYAFDVDEFAVQTYRRNIGDHVEQADIRKLGGKKLMKRLGLKEVDLLSGGPPCQGFSKQKRGAHSGADGRNDLVVEYARLVSEISPRSFLFENVQIFGQKRGLDLIAQIELSLPQYRIHRFFVNASAFGLAQRRGRFMMMGIRKDVSDATPLMAMTTKLKTVRDVIGDLPPPPIDGTEHPTIANHIQCRITALNATPNPGYYFAGWTEAGASASTASAYSFAVTNPRTLVANFAPLPDVAIAPQATTPNSLTISWPAPSNGWILEESADLVNWTPSTRAVTLAGARQSVTVTPVGPGRYFRLSHP